MNWNTILSELGKRMTLQEIADGCGLASKGHVHDLKSGRQKTVSFETGAAIVALHKKVMRRKGKE